MAGLSGKGEGEKVTVLVLQSVLERVQGDHRNLEAMGNGYNTVSGLPKLACLNREVLRKLFLDIINYFKIVF